MKCAVLLTHPPNSLYIQCPKVGSRFVACLAEKLPRFVVVDDMFCLEYLFRTSQVLDHHECEVSKDCFSPPFGRPVLLCVSFVSSRESKKEASSPDSQKGQSVSLTSVLLFVVLSCLCALKTLLNRPSTSSFTCALSSAVSFFLSFCTPALSFPFFFDLLRNFLFSSVFSFLFLSFPFLSLFCSLSFSSLSFRLDQEEEEKKPRDKEKPKAPANGYMIFCKDHRTNLTEQIRS